MLKMLFFVLFAHFLVVKPIYENEQDILIFYHIPKTGGMSVSSVLDAQFSPESICDYHYYHNIKDKTAEELINYKLIRGHFFFRSPLSDIKNAKSICFFRDPIERVLSEQRFLEQYFPNNPEVVCLHHSLPPGNPIDTINNQYCRFLSGYDSQDPTITDEMHLTNAKHNLENRFFFVGLTEKMNESIWILYTLMNWEIPMIIPKLNGTYEQSELRNPQLIESIRQKNWADIELYEFAMNLFKKRYKEVLHLELREDYLLKTESDK
jgi:hypothetical protein